MSTGRTFALLTAIVFIFLGVAGYLPRFTNNHLLFGYFQVNDFHNNVHIFTGIIALLASTKGNFARLFFQVFGIIYAVVTIIGFLKGAVLAMPLNMADNYLHLVIAVVFLLLGFFYKKY